MRLFLSSYRAGRHDNELLKFIGNISKIAVITNAKDYKTPEDRQFKIDDNFNYYRSIGLEPTEVDLRPFFHKTGAEKLLDGYDFVWLAGGNVFLLRRALAYTGMDEFLINKVKSNSIILGGESAGAIIAAPNLHGSEDEDTPGHEDDPNYTPDPYDKKIIWDGLGFINYVLVPHYKSPEVGESIEEYIKYLRDRNMPYKTITDQQAVIIDCDKEEFLK